MPDFDYIVTVGADAEGIVRNSMEKYGEVKKTIEGDSVTLHINPNEKDLSKIIKEINSLDLKTNLNIEIDNTAFQKSLRSLESFSGKSAGKIASQFKNEIEDGFSTLNIKQLLESELGGGTKTGGAVGKLVSKLNTGISFDIADGSSYDDILKQAQAIERLNRVITEVQATNIRGIKKGKGQFSIGDNFTFNTSEFEKGRKDFFANAGKYFQANLSSLVASVNNSFDEARLNLLNLLSGGGGTGIPGGSTPLNLNESIEAMEAEVSAAYKHLKNLEKEAKDLGKIKERILKSAQIIGEGELSPKETEKEYSRLHAYTKMYEGLGGKRTDFAPNIRREISTAVADSAVSKEDLFGIEKQRAEYSRLNGELDRLYSLSDSMNEDLVGFSDDSAEVERLQNELSDLSSTLSKLTDDFATVTAKCDEQKEAIKSLSAELDKYKGKSDKYDSLSDELSRTKSQADAYLSAYTQVNHELEEANSKLKSLDGKDISADELATQTKKVQELEIALKRIDSLYAQQAKHVEELTQKISRLEAENKSLDEEARDNNSEAVELRNKYEEINQKHEEALALLKKESDEAERLRAAFDGMSTALSDAIAALGNVKFDPLAQANKQLAQFAKTGDQAHYDKAASYYGLYRDRGGKKSITFEKEGRDVSADLLERYKKLASELPSAEDQSGLLKLLNQQNAIVRATRDHAAAIEAEKKALEKKIQELEKLEAAHKEAEKAAMQHAKAEEKVVKAEDKSKPQESEEEKAKRREAFKQNLKKTETKSVQKKDASTEKKDDKTSAAKTSPDTSVKSAKEIEAEAKAARDLNTEIGKVKNSVTEKTNAFTTEQSTVSSVVQSEKNDLNSLGEAVKGVTGKIDDKSREFQKEGQIVSGVAQSEITDLSSIDGWINILIRDIGELTTAIKNIPKIELSIKGAENANIPLNFISQVDLLKNVVSGFNTDNLKVVTNSINALKVDSSVGDNLQKFSNAFLNFKSNMNNFSSASKEMLELINNLLSKKDELSNLAKILSQTKSKIESAAKSAGVKQKNNTPRVAGWNVVSLDDDYVKEMLPAWNERFRKQLGHIVEVQSSVRDSKDGPLESYKLKGIDGSSITIGKNQRIIAERKNVVDSINMIDAATDSMYSEMNSALDSLMNKQTKLNKLIAKDISGQNVGAQLALAYEDAESELLKVDAILERIESSKNSPMGLYNISDSTMAYFKEERNKALLGSDESIATMTDAATKQEAKKAAEKAAKEKAEAEAEAKKEAERIANQEELRQKKSQYYTDLYKEMENSIKSVEDAQTELNNLVAKEISGETVMERLIDKGEKAENAIRTAEHRLDMLKEAAKRGHIDKIIVDNYQNDLNDAKIGNSASRDAIMKAIEKDEAKIAQEKARIEAEIERLKAEKKAKQIADQEDLRKSKEQYYIDLYKETENAIKAVENAHTELNKVIAKGISGDTVVERLFENSEKAEQSIRDAEYRLELLQEAVNRGFIDQGKVDTYKVSLEDAKKGNGSSRDAIADAIKKDVERRTQKVDATKLKKQYYNDLYSSIDESIEKVLMSQTKLNRLAADEIGGKTVAAELAEQSNIAAQAIEETRRQLDLLEDAAKHGHISWDDYNIRKANFDNALTGNSDSVDKLEAAYLNKTNDLLSEQESLLAQINDQRGKIALATEKGNVKQKQQAQAKLKEAYSQFQENEKLLRELDPTEDARKDRVNRYKKAKESSNYLYSSVIEQINADKKEKQLADDSQLISKYEKNLKELARLEKRYQSTGNASDRYKADDIRNKLDESWKEIESLWKNKRISDDIFNDIERYKQVMNSEIDSVRAGQSSLLSAESFKDAATGYRTLADNAYRYYSILEKQRQGKSLTHAEIADLVILEQNYRDAANGVGIYADTLAKAAKTEKNFYEKQVASAKSTIKSASAASLDSELKNLLNFKDGEKPDQYKAYVDEIVEKVKVLNGLLPIDELTTANDLAQINSLTAEIKEMISVAKSAPEFSFAKEDKKQKLDDKISKWMSNNTAALKKYGTELDALREKLKAVGLTNADISDIESTFQNITKTARDAGKVGDSFVKNLGARFKSLGTYLLSFASFYDVINVLRKAYTIIKDMDDALTEMRKVSDTPLATLKEHQKETFSLADNVGSTAKQLQQSTADWMRLGEALNDAKESAKDTNILFNVSEFENIDDATQSLVSMSQAYKDLDKMDIIDKLNIVGNNFSISTDDLATALQKSAAVLQTQGNDIDEAIALITAGNAIGQDSDSTAAGIRTISLRIAGTEEAKKELESLGEDVEDYVVQTSSKTDAIIKKYTAVASNAGKGISVLDDNGNLRDTYDILLDISKVYAEIQEQDKKSGTNRAQALIEVLAGKNRSNIAASILQNGEMLESVYKMSSEDFAGSSQEELDKYLDSVTGKFTQLQNSLSELAFTAFNTDALKTGLDILTNIVSAVTSLVDVFGSLNVAISTVVATLATSKGFGKQIVVYNAPFYKIA